MCSVLGHSINILDFTFSTLIFFNTSLNRQFIEQVKCRTIRMSNVRKNLLISSIFFTCILRKTLRNNHSNFQRLDSISFHYPVESLITTLLRSINLHLCIVAEPIKSDNVYAIHFLLVKLQTNIKQNLCWIMIVQSSQ